MADLGYIPSSEELLELLGEEKLKAWSDVYNTVDSLYVMDKIWFKGGKSWKLGLRYRRGGKSLCTLHADKDRYAFLIVFGAAEREKVELIRDTLSPATLAQYDDAQIFTDGKWVMFNEFLPVKDIASLLAVKRKPNLTGSR